MPLIATTVASITAAVLANAYATCLLSLPGNPINNLTIALETLPDFASSQLPLSTSSAALVTSLLAACAVWAAWAYSLTHRPAERVGEEHGSAKWGTKREGQKFLDPSDLSNNIILTESFGLAMSAGTTTGATSGTATCS
jgi:type IV secretion system protein VirD4